MKIIRPSYTVLTQPPRVAVLALLEVAGRTCYKTEGKITEDSASPFVSKICQVYKHESVIEHAGATVKFIVDRGVSHELVRHRLASYSQESTRYCNYAADKFGREITVIEPPFFEPDTTLYNTWVAGCRAAENAYFSLLDAGASAQEARSVLPNSLKTEVVMTANLREWKHVFKMRCASTAHPQIRQVMIPLQREFVAWLPEIFEDP